MLFCPAIGASSAFAGQLPTNDPVAEAPMHVGFVGVRPRFALTDAGFDTNVFNERVNPKRDFTATLSPGADLWLRTGKGLLSASGTLDLVHFNTYVSERSVNSNAKVQYEFRFNRFRPYVSGATVNTQDRPGFEIDKRVRHFESDYHVGTDLRVASKGAVSVDLRHRTYTVADNEIFDGRLLSEELNRTLQVADLGWRQRLTSQTTWIARLSRESERFMSNVDRNSDSFRMTTGFELGQFALIRGSAFVGYRRLSAADGGTLPEFSGITADVNVAYTMPTQTRLSAVISRDLEYSYERRTPYYIQTGLRATLTQRLIGRWDAQVSVGRDRLAYEALAEFIDRQRTDFVNRIGGGIGYTPNQRMRIGFDVTSYDRKSDLPDRGYRGTRGGMSVTYGY